MYIVDRADSNTERLMTDYRINDNFDGHITFRGRPILLGK